MFTIFCTSQKSLIIQQNTHTHTHTHTHTQNGDYTYIRYSKRTELNYIRAVQPQVFKKIM